MNQTAKMNAIRSGIVVVGALAFGYLSFRLGFKPYLERAEAALESAGPSQPSLSQSEHSPPTRREY
ncbi:hypothetical protein CRG98_002446 [Punica granatum]|uniref:Uncharacterized protein n=1 Tax=Punica granatum TaxID=22663 RepID=A0A2I0L8Y5_PUNGR|nr:hypothetical protein CRG98_002446 [Punica granatum]